MIISKIPQMDEHEIARFWAKVDKTEGFGPNGDCWKWTASTSTTGYGQWVRGKKGEQKSYRAHRIAYFLETGKQPTKILCHTCANPLCVNPSHVYEGTHTDNMYDAFKDGARPSYKPKEFHHVWGEDSKVGERHHNAKLNPDKVRQIRKWGRERVPERTIAKWLGVGSCAVGCVLRGQTWKHVTDEP